ncbi:hypothetical protein ACPPVV_16220 [Rhodanobacter sp. Col0626]|uniref:hypothetical protein n=1 Tax=Rhodanobacter sp. Col0626 TaxID=3415679 RepID=UPI003CF54D79
MSTSPSYVYKFNGRIPVITVVITLVGLCVLLAVLIVRQGGGLAGVSFCLGSAFFFLLIGSIFFLGRANIVVDDNSISRTFLGKKFKVLQWKDIERIVVFPVRGSGASQNVIGYNVVASSERSGLSNTKKIYFNDQSNDLSSLVKCMNTYVDRFGIRVERVIDGTTTLAKSI